MRILVTGAAGFIGFHTVNHLLKSGFQVTGLDNLNDYYSPQLKLDRLSELGVTDLDASANEPVSSVGHRDFQFIRMDLLNFPELCDLVRTRDFDCIIHLAAQAGVRYSLENPHSYIKNNVEGFLNILETCRHLSTPRLIYASSSSVYGGNEKLPYQESDPVDDPVSLYAVTKRSNELMAHTYRNLYGIRSMGLRFFTVYGPWGRPDMAYYTFTEKILQGEPLPVFNHGRQSRSFSYVSDVVEALNKLLHRLLHDQGDPVKILNIGGAQEIPLMDFIAKLEKALNRKATINFLPAQPGDVQSTQPDLTQLHHLIGELSLTDLDTGIGHFIDWYNRYYNRKQK